MDEYFWVSVLFHQGNWGFIRENVINTDIWVIIKKER